MSTVLDKFLRYVKIDTQSQDGATTVPSTDKQRNLASLLAQELNDMGAQDVVYDKAHCYVYATIPSNLPEGKTAPVIGFISHMDTSPAVSGENVNPRVVAYEGGDIVLNAEKNIVLTEKENPELAHFVGKQLRLPTQLMPKLAAKIWYCMEKRSWLPIVLLQENSVITARTVTVKFSLLKKIYQKFVL